MSHHRCINQTSKLHHHLPCYVALQVIEQLILRSYPIPFIYVAFVINNLRDELNNVDVFLSNHIQFEKYIFIHTYRDSILLNNVEVQVKIIEEHRSSHFFINKKNVAYKCLTMAESCRFVGLISPRMPYDVSREYILLISVFQFVRLNCTYDSLM